MPEESPASRVVLHLSIASTKTALNASRDEFVWSEGDMIRVFNDVDASAPVVVISDGECEVDIPSGTGEIYAIYPQGGTSAGGASAARVTVPVEQVQSEGGVFPGINYPMGGRAAVSGASASCTLSPLACALAFNIYDTNSGRPAAVSRVILTPLDNSSFAGDGAVDLTAARPSFTTGSEDARYAAVSVTRPVSIADHAPSAGEEKRTWPGQIYLTLARQRYSKVRIDVVTDVGTYRFTTSGEQAFECTEHDILLTNINLAKGSVIVESDHETWDLSGSMDYYPGGLEDPSVVRMDTTDRIPDFSRVGYKYGDEAIPMPAVAATVTPASVAEALGSGAYADTTAYLQAVIDMVGGSGGGAVLLKNGTYNTCRPLFVDYDNTVLRGESRSGTILYAHGTDLIPVVALGATSEGRACTVSSMAVAGTGGASSFGEYSLDIVYPVVPSRTLGRSSQVDEDYVPVGREYVRVVDASIFSTGDEITIFRPRTLEWLADIGMDKIADNGRSVSPTSQWTDRTTESYFTRKVVAIKGRTLYLDAPIVQSLDRNYGGGIVYKSGGRRICGSGVENLTIDSAFDASVTYGGNCVDESHAWSGVCVFAAQDCWIKDITASHMGYALVNLYNRALRITVENCSSLSPVSVISGGRRYAYVLTGGELCLIKNCTADRDRHAFCSNGHRVAGPNVFTNCTGTNMYSVMGPHQDWSMGTLYDCMTTDRGFAVEDRGNSGNGHGWSGANTVFWNIEAASYVVCQSPWAAENTSEWTFSSQYPSARNYAVGVVGIRQAYDEKVWLDYYGSTVTDYYMNTLGIPQRPDGRWYPQIAVGAAGTLHVSLPDDDAAVTCAWWPALTLPSYSHPLSLYQCQLEDRHARGVYLNSL